MLDALPTYPGVGASPTFAGITVSGLTASRLVATSGAKALASVADLASWIAGTAAEITATNDGDGTLTLSLPAALTFTGKTITGGTYAGAALNGTLGATTPAAAVVTSLTANTLTSGRVPYLTTGGAFTDSANLTFNGSKLTVATSTGNTLYVSSTETATSYSSGCAIFCGGVGIQGKLFGVNIRLDQNITNTDNLTTLQVLSRQTTTASSTGYLNGFSVFTTHVVGDTYTQSGYVNAFKLQNIRNYSVSGDKGTLAQMACATMEFGHYNTDGTAAPATTYCFGLDMYPYAYSGTIAALYGIRINAVGGGGTVTTYRGIYIDNGKGTNNRAIEIAAQTGGSTNYAILCAGAGLVKISDTTDASAIGTAALIGLGGASIAKSLWVGGTAGNYVNIANATGELRVNGTKVVAARVVDARASDTPNSGDATTDGLIDALRDAMVSHGLIAAA